MKAHQSIAERYALAITAGVIILFIIIALSRVGADEPEITPAPVEVQELPVNFIIRPIALHVYQYLSDNYAARDKNVIVLVATWDDWCMGVTCQYWVVKPHFTQLAIMLRCYPDFGNQCVPTYENEQVLPAPGQQPTPTNYAPPESIMPGQGVGAPES